MRVEDCYTIGSFIKTHGFKGALSLKLDVDFPEQYKELDSFFVTIGGNLVPFFVAAFELGNKGIAKVHLEDIDSEEKAKSLVGKPLYLPLDLLPKLEGNQFYFHEVTGFAVEDETHGPIGHIKAVIDNGPQALLQITFKGQDILIPVTDDFIVSLDRDKELMHVRCPEGLIDLYLGEG